MLPGPGNTMARPAEMRSEPPWPSPNTEASPATTASGPQACSCGDTHKTPEAGPRCRTRCLTPRSPPSLVTAHREVLPSQLLGIHGPPRPPAGAQSGHRKGGGPWEAQGHTGPPGNGPAFPEQLAPRSLATTPMPCTQTSTPEGEEEQDRPSGKACCLGRGIRT